ncbi:MAG: UBP-type zinc finger domain-containing protein [Candidatus Promineifilaceae bacterium]
MPNSSLGMRIQQFVDELNEGNIESVRRYLSANWYNYSPGADQPSAFDIYHDILSDLKSAISNLHIEFEPQNETDDVVQGVMKLSGATDGTLWGAPATNKSVTWTVNASVRKDGDRFAVNFDDVSVPGLIGTLRQLNLVPPPEEMDKPSIYPVVVPEAILQALYNGTMEEKECDHLDSIKVYESELDVCEKCAASGDVWPALRLCLICGYVGCCDTSKNKHMKQHYQETGHGLFRSIRLNEGWGWCYDHNAFFSSRRLEKYYHPKS